MKYGVSTSRPALVLVLGLLFSLSTLCDAAWEKISLSDNRESLDTVWGTSDDNVYVIGFTGHVYHKQDGTFSAITDSVFGDMSINHTLADPQNHPLTRLPYGLGGTDENNAYVTGMTVKTEYLIPANAVSWSTTLYEATPFVMRYDGAQWTDIVLDTGLDSKYIPQVIVGVCGTGPEQMFFSGWKVLREPDGDPKDDSNTGVILGCDALTGHWTGDVGRGDLTGAAFQDHIPEINEITMAGASDVFAVGFDGLIVHKTLPHGNWEVMPTESSSLRFLRVWGTGPDHVFAVGYNNSNFKAVIYRYRNNTWTAMGLPPVKQGQIPALWGLWGESETMIHAVGNSGVSLYYDGNSGNQWYAMLSGTTTSLNCVWAADFNHAYACGEDGNIYRYTEGIRTDGVAAYPMISLAPSEVEFTDISPGDVTRWEWNFNDVVSGSVAPVADLDYAILITAIDDVSINGCRVKVTNDNATQTAYLVTDQALSAQTDLSGKLLVTAAPGSAANNSTIHIQETLTDPVPAIYHHTSEIIVKVVAGVTSQAEVADLLESLDLIDSAIPDSPAEPWFSVSGEAVSSATLTGGQDPTLHVKIDSGYTTHREIANLLETHDWIDSAVADNPETVWIRGREQVGNLAVFAGGMADSNVFVNTDTSTADYYMAYHTYTQPGIYEASLTITRPSLPPVGTIVVREEQLPDSLNYTQSLFIAGIPGTLLNSFSVHIEDGGAGCTPEIRWTDSRVTAVIESGVTLQSELAALLLRHHHILAALPTYPDKPWHVADSSVPDSVMLYGGTSAGIEISSVPVRVLSETPFHVTITPSSGVDDLYATFAIIPDDIIRDLLYKSTWYFDYRNTDNYGSVSDGTIKISTNPDETIVHHYTEIGTYNVAVTVLLDDNSSFNLFKENAVIVKSADEGKNSLSGGSGLGDVSGCFIGVLGE